MLLITCFCCGATSEETEFHRECEAHILRNAGSESTDDEFADYLFYRKNTKGVCFEQWRHVFGCGKFFHIAKCSKTLEIFGTYSIEDRSPPEHILKVIKERTRKYGES